MQRRNRGYESYRWRPFEVIGAMASLQVEHKTVEQGLLVGDVIEPL